MKIGEFEVKENTFSIGNNHVIVYDDGKIGVVAKGVHCFVHDFATLENILYLVRRYHEKEVQENFRNWIHEVK